jgi:hypothetical protein
MYEVGQFYIKDRESNSPELYFLAKFNRGVALIDMHSGNRWSDGGEGCGFTINEDEWERVTSGHSEKFRLINIKIDYEALRFVPFIPQTWEV